MDDLAITRACAEAMGFEFNDGDADCLMVAPTVSDMKAAAAPFPIERTIYSWFRWNPLEDDAQAMALVKRFQLEIGWYADGRASVNYPNPECPNWIAGDTLNRAICTAVAKLHAATSERPDDRA